VFIENIFYVAGSFVFKISHGMTTVPCKRIIYGKILNDSAGGGWGE
jgi:hypothetical protein